MSKLAFSGNENGSGIFTIAAPNSNTDRTITLPDHAGTVLASASITVDETNGRLGIGTASPQFRLNSVQDSASAAPSLTSAVQVYAKGYGGSGQHYAGIGFAMHEHTNGYWGSGVLARDDTGSYGSALSFYTSSGSATPSPTEKMRIDSSGNVGIGTSVPTTYGDGNTKFAVVSDTSGTADVNIRWGTNAVKGILYCNDVSGAGIGIGSTTSAYLGFLSNGTERMRITSSGQVFVNTTSAAEGSEKFCLDFSSNTGPGIILQDTTIQNNTTFIGFHNGSSRIGAILASGTSNVTYSTSSDYRLKENVVEVTDGIVRLKLLKPSRFNFISDPDKTVDGFLAHEVQDVVPEAITGTKDEVDADGNPKYQGIDQSKLVPLLTAALQEAITKIESLEARITALET